MAFRTALTHLFRRDLKFERLDDDGFALYFEKEMLRLRKSLNRTGVSQGRDFFTLQILDGMCWVRVLKK